MLEKEIFNLIVSSNAIGANVNEIVLFENKILLCEKLIIHRNNNNDAYLFIKEGDSGDTIESVSSSGQFDDCNIKFHGPFSGVYFKTYFGNFPSHVDYGEITEISICGKSGIFHIKIGDISTLLFSVAVDP